MGGLTYYQRSQRSNGFKPGRAGEPKEKKLRAAIYVRVSTEEQAESGYSIRAQQESLEAFCKAKGWEAVPPYVDDGYSGKNLDRPAITRLIEDARRKKFDLVLVYKIDRLSRRLGDLSELRELFDGLGIGLSSVTEPFDTTTAPGALLFHMLGSFAQFEREVIGERTRLGLGRRKREGKWNGLPPFGYKMSKEGTLEIHPGEFPYARKVFDLCLSHNLGVKTITRRMREEDHCTRRSQGRWRYNSVWNMLTNPVYAGFVEMDGKPEPRHKGIVTPVEFERVRDIMNGRWRASGEQVHSPNFLLGLVRCGRCGRNMTTMAGTGKSGRKYHYYHCPGRGRDSGCDMEYVAARPLEEAILREVARIASMPKVIERYLARHRRRLKERGAVLSAERAALQKRIEGAQRAKDNKVHWLLETLPEKSVAFEVSREIQAKLDDVERLKSQLADVEVEIKDLLTRDTQAEVVAEFLTRFTDHFDELETTQKRFLIQNLVQEVVVKSAQDSRVVYTLPLPPSPQFDFRPPATASQTEKAPLVPLELLRERGVVFPARYQMG